MRATEVGVGGTVEPRIDFVGIGSQRSGTSWVFASLMQHPCLHGPIGGAEKEVNFFNHHYTRGYHWYHSLFRFGAWKNGEFSVLYLPEASSPERMYQYRDDLRLIVCVRNPIERAYSQHLHEIRRGRVPRSLVDFERALASNPSYVQQGFYSTYLMRFYELFGPERIHVVVFDDISTRPGEVLAALYAFLGVDTSFRSELETHVVNAARPPRSAGIRPAIRLGSRLLERLGAGEVTINLKRNPNVRRVLRQTERDFTAQEIVPMTDKVRDELRQTFAGEIDQLSAMLNRNLKHWS